MKKFTFLDHKADIKFRAEGKNLEELIENCVEAVAHYMVSGKKVKEKTRKKVIFEEEMDNERLLYRIMEEILFLLETEHFLTASAEVKISQDKVVCVFIGDRSIDYEIQQVKAATYSEMHVKKVKGKWQAQIVLDV